MPNVRRSMMTRFSLWSANSFMTQWPETSQNHLSYSLRQAYGLVCLLQLLGSGRVFWCKPGNIPTSLVQMQQGHARPKHSMQNQMPVVLQNDLNPSQTFSVNQRKVNCSRLDMAPKMNCIWMLGLGCKKAAACSAHTMGQRTALRCMDGSWWPPQKSSSGHKNSDSFL